MPCNPWNRYWRVLLIVTALIAIFPWSMAAGQALTVADFHYPTPAPILSPFILLNDLAQRLSGGPAPADVSGPGLGG
jgi:hypothetical protein